MKPPAFQFYAADFMMGTVTMTAEEVGAYIRLLCLQWDLGSLPNDDATLARLGGCGGNAVASIRVKFQVGPDGKLRNPRMEAEREKQRVYREKQAENGAKRWAGNAKPHAMVKPTHEPEAMPNACSPSPSPSSVSVSDSAFGPGAEQREINRHLPKDLDTGPFREAWAKWVTYWPTRRPGGVGVIPQATADNHLTILLKLGPIDAVAAIENSISKGWADPQMPFTAGAGGSKPSHSPAWARS